MIKRKIHIPIYEQMVEVYYGNYKKIKKINDRHGCSELKEGIDGRSIWIEKTNLYLLLLRRDAKLSHGDIAHECKHLVNFIFMNIDIELKKENDEAECYLLGWIVDQIHSIIKI